MKISVITVCYNSASTVLDTLRSVAAQSHPEIEHIVVDGASTDGTQEIVRTQGAHVAKFVSERDRGIYDAMNKGLALATGDIIGTLNADDLYAHEHVLRTVAKAFEDKTLDALLGDVGYFRTGSPDTIVRRYNSGRFKPERIAWGWMPAHPALFLHRRIYEQVGHYKTDYRIAGDFEFIARAFSQADIHYQHLPEILVKMRLGGASTAGLKATLRLNREVMRACRENAISTSWINILSKYPFKLMEFHRQ